MSAGALVAVDSNSNNALATTDHEAEAEQAFIREAEENEKTIRELQFQLGRIEDQRRQAVKETNLVREIKSINMLTQRKVDATVAETGDDSAASLKSPVKRKNQLPLTEETKARIIGLEDAMRIETNKTLQLQEESRLVASQVEKLEKEIAAVDGQLTVAEKQTGRPRTGGTSYHEVNLENVIGRLKASLAKLDEEQRTKFSVTTKLTKQIDELGAELEAMSEVDRLLVEAQQTLTLKTREHELLGEEVNRQNRIAQKKEKHITTFSLDKDISEFRTLEQNKKMLHVELQKAHEARRIAARAVEVNAVALRRIEAQLGGISQALALVFAQENESVTSEQRAPHPVPIRQFDDVRQSIEDCRRAIGLKDRQLEGIDAEVEALERKVDILQQAQQSKQSSAYLGFRQLVKERDALQQHLDVTLVEFRAEQRRLAQENELLERQTGSRSQK